MQNKTAPELKPCPFCGGKPRVIERAASMSESGNYAVFIACHCGGYSAHAHHGRFASTKEAAFGAAAEAWNRRAPSEPVAVTEAIPNWNGWRSIDTAPEDKHVILATSGGHVGEAIMLIDEDTGQQKWAWALGPLHPNHIPYGWMPFQEPPTAPVLSDLRPDGFDGPTGAE